MLSSLSLPAALILRQLPSGNTAVQLENTDTTRAHARRSGWCREEKPSRAVQEAITQDTW
jgi:hypothetical protein